MWNLVRPILGGVKSFVPGLDYAGSGGTASAWYCYAVWTRHLAVLSAHGVRAAGATMIELGPGDTLGVSLAALLTGVSQVIGLDTVPHASASRNRQMFADLVALVSARTAPPNSNDLPDVRPYVPWLRTLDQLVDAQTLERALAPERLARIDQELAQTPGGPEATSVRYVCPWTAATVPPASADLVISQAVLEYLPHDGPRRASDDDSRVTGNDELARAFDAMHAWLRTGGVMSHQIDLMAPFGPEWNAHWAVGDAAWALIVGRRPYYENRVPLSGYLELCARHGFEVLATHVTPAPPGLTRDRLAPRFRALPAADYTARGVHLVARKR